MPKQSKPDHAPRGITASRRFTARFDGGNGDYVEVELKDNDNVRLNICDYQCYGFSVVGHVTLPLSDLWAVYVLAAQLQGERDALGS